MKTKNFLKDIAIGEVRYFCVTPVNMPKPKVIPIPLTQPSPAEVRSARNAVGLTQVESAELVGMKVNLKSKPPQSRGWQDAEASDGKLIPSTWLLFQLLTNQHPDYKLVSMEKDRE